MVAESYRLWLQYDSRTDDITMMVIQIVGLEDEAPQLALPTPIGYVCACMCVRSCWLEERWHRNDQDMVLSACRAPWEYSQRAVASRSVRSRRRPPIELGGSMLDTDDDKVNPV